MFILVHIEDLRHSSTCLYYTLFSCQFPIKANKIGSDAGHRDRKAARTGEKVGMRLSVCAGSMSANSVSALLPHKKGTAAACSHTEEAGKNPKTGFILWSPGYHKRKKCEISIYILNMNV
jgi:hypothetical protein